MLKVHGLCDRNVKGTAEKTVIDFDSAPGDELQLGSIDYRVYMKQIAELF